MTEFQAGAPANYVISGSPHMALQAGSIGAVYLGDVARRITAETLTSERVRELLNGYEAGPSRDAAATALRSHHAVILSGTAGIGRQTLALDLLSSLHPPGGIHKLPLDPANMDNTSQPREPRTGYLIDATDPGDAPADEINRFIAGYATALKEIGSYVVVTADDDEWVRRSLVVPVVQVVSPSGLRVFQRKLESSMAADEATRWTGEPRITALLTGARATDAARLAGIAAGLVTAGVPFDEAVTSAVGAYHDWQTDLLKWFDGHEQIAERAFIFAAAVLHDGPAVTASTAAQELARQLDPAQKERVILPLQGPPLGIRAREIDAELSEQGMLRFSRPGYAPAVRNFVWHQYAGSRDELTTWLATVPGKDERRVLDSIAELATVNTDEKLIDKVADAWSRQRHRLAVAFLGDLAVDRVMGRKTRDLLYQWAYAADAPEHRLLTVAGACAVYGAAYEQNALTRLRQVAKHTQEKVVEEVVATLRAFADEPRRRRRILHEIAVVWPVPGHDERTATARRAFAELARVASDSGPPLLIADLAEDRHAVEPDLAAALRGLLVDDPSRATTVLDYWVHHAVADPDLAEPVFNVLVAAAAGDGTATARLNYVANAWALAGDETAETAALHAFAHRIVQATRHNDPLVYPVPAVSAEAADGE